MKLFGVCLQHRYDPAKWELLMETNVRFRVVSYAGPIGDPLDKGRELTYRNVCLDCGALAFKKVREVGE